jgi:hypothetical protein
MPPFIPVGRRSQRAGHLSTAWRRREAPPAHEIISAAPESLGKNARIADGVTAINDRGRRAPVGDRLRSSGR